jgi:acetyltransferase-like isoleucine patch superfamily enzyme
MISTLKHRAEIRIGKRCGFSGTVIAAATSITIDDDVMCGANVTITDTDWHGHEPDKRHEQGPTKSIHICRNVWIGMNVVIMKGVTIGENSIICVGSIVTKSIPPNSVALGQPAQVVKTL